MDLLDRLRERGLPSTTVPIRTGRVADVQKAREALDEAIRLRDKHPKIDEVLEQAVRDAKASLDALYEDVEVRAIPPTDYEALVRLHPPTEEQEDGGFGWNPDTFVPALLAACVDLPWSEQEWVEMCSAGPLALGETVELFQAAAQINSRSPDLRLGKRLAADGQLAMEMAVCAAYKISHSHFLGGPRLWTQDDRDKAIAWQIRQAETCRSCGTHPAEWDERKGGHRHAYEAVIRICPGCEVRERTEVELQEGKYKKVRGKLVVMKRNPRAASKRRRRTRG